MKSTLILLGLAAGVLCDTTVRTRLGQVKSKTLAEQANAATCACAIPLGAVGGETPSLSFGTYNSFAHSAAATTGETVQTVPDVAQTETAVSQACACSQNSEQSTASGSVGRHYAVTGAIEVGEEVFYSATGSSNAASNGARHKQAACVVNNVNGTTGAGAGNNCPSVCVQGSSATFGL